MQETTDNIITKVAAIDMGSNTFRLLIAQVDGKELDVLLKKNVTVKLGQGLSTTNDLAPVTIKKALAVLADFRNIISKYNIDCYRYCGTEALRKANNSEAFLEMASEVVGGKVEIISGDEEARLCCLGVLAGLAPTTSSSLLVVDVGGGSTELIYIRERSAQPVSVSLPAGAVSFTELGRTNHLQLAFAAFSTGLREFLELNQIANDEILVIGTGGTATALAAIDLSLESYDENKVQGHNLMAESINKIGARLLAMPSSARQFLPVLEEGRGNIIMAGIEIYQEIIATIGVGGMIISDSGLLEGIMMSCLGRDLELSS